MPMPKLVYIAPALLSTLSVLAQNTPLKLIPIPREVHRDTDVVLSRGLRIDCPGCTEEDTFTATEIQTALEARQIKPSPDSVRVLLQRKPEPNWPQAMRPEGYVITSSTQGLSVTAETGAGLFYGAQTVKQLVDGMGVSAVLHLAEIKDWPAMKYRGLHDDLSRGPVPTLAFQKHLIQVLAAYKANVYSPYFEHTQLYTSHPIAAPPNGAVTPEDARELTAFAAKYHVTIIPEQEAFGHLRHTLVWEQYKEVAETPHGAVLSPAQPESLKLIKDWFTELASDYPNTPFLHIGADETIELGLGQTKAEVTARGRAAVYLDFLQQIVTTLKPLNRRLLFWGDVAQDSPGLLKSLPQSFKNATIAVAWGYTPNPTGGFLPAIKPFLDAGIETWVSPSPNNYRQVYPNFHLGLPDIQQFTAEGQRAGATGQLNTLWNDDGESLIDQDWYGIVFGAAAAWQPGPASIPAFQDAFGSTFHGDKSGKVDEAQRELMAAMSLLTKAEVIAATEGTDGLFWVDPWSADGQAMAARMRPINSELRLHAENAIQLIADARATQPSPRQPATPVSQSPIQTAYSYAVPNDPVNAYPSAPTTLREPNALDAMEFGARRIDFLGLRFQLADEIQQGYQRALIAQASTDPKLHRSVSRELSDLNGVNGRMQDIFYTYAQLRDLFAQTWLRTNRPSGLQLVLERYDRAAQLWIDRSDKVRVAQRQYTALKTLPTSASVGIPATVK